MRGQRRPGAACARCARKKVRCDDVPGADSCRRCLDEQTECAWPGPFGDPTGSGRVLVKNACDACRATKMRCDRDENDETAACARCVELVIKCCVSARDRNRHQAGDRSPLEAGPPAASGGSYNGQLRGQNGHHVQRAALEEAGPPSSAGPSVSSGQRNDERMNNDIPAHKGSPPAAPSNGIGPVEPAPSLTIQTAMVNGSTTSRPTSPNSVWWRVVMESSPEPGSA